jgi:hypothetical protein
LDEQECRREEDKGEKPNAVRNGLQKDPGYAQRYGTGDGHANKNANEGCPRANASSTQCLLIHRNMR